MKIPLPMIRGIFTRRRINEHLHDFGFDQRLQVLPYKNAWADRYTWRWPGYFFVLIRIFLYGLKYSSVYPATNQAKPANRMAAIHFKIVLMLCSILFECCLCNADSLQPEGNDAAFT
jgi:hypothetical protein